MTKKLFIGVHLLGIAMVLIAATVRLVKPTPPPPSTGQIKVTTSFYPLYFFTSEIAKDRAIVANITPAGAEPHEYEPSARDIAQLETTQLLIVHGLGLETWLEKVMPELQQKYMHVAVATDGLQTINIENEGRQALDAHTWLDPMLAKQEVANITQALITIDPQHKGQYEMNGKELGERLDGLDQEFRTVLAQCKQKNIVTSHQAFGYLAVRYGLRQVAIAGLSPDQEPSPARLGDVAQFVKTNHVKYIFFETLVSPRLAETIAQETGARTLVLDPIEGVLEADQAAGRDYFTIQRENLRNLKIALECR